MPYASPSLASPWTVSSTLPASPAMMTAVPPAATTSVAVWRPIPLLPPTTTSFCPAKIGMAIGRSFSSALSMPSSQFVLIAFVVTERSFLLDGRQACCLLTGDRTHGRRRRWERGHTTLSSKGISALGRSRGPYHEFAHAEESEAGSMHCTFAA